MPSLALSLWLVLAAAAGSPDAQPAAARMREPGKPSVPVAAAPRPPTAPSGPANAKVPPIPMGKSKPAPRLEEVVPIVDEPEEEVFVDSKAKGHRRGSRKTVSVERGEAVQERKPAWSTDRYAAVVPPGLTLAALRGQLGKTPVAPEAAAPAADLGPAATLADIEKAREALRQETARLEALLKATGNCGGNIGMTMGDGFASPTMVSPTALREAPTEQIDAVSKTMKGMKPEQAAALVSRLDRALAAEIIRRMKPADAGAILGLLKPELAAELATQIATRKPAPVKDKKAGGR